MKLIDGYESSAFTREQVVRIGEMLGIEDHFAARCVAAKITGVLYLCMRQEAARNAVPDTKAARRRLDRIATLSAHLAKLMAEEPLSIELTRAAGDIMDRSGPDGSIDMNCILAEDRDRFNEFVDTLRVVGKNAETFSGNDHGFRLAAFLPTVDQSGRSTLAINLWPALFEIWVEAGKKLAQTPHGPLHRFIGLIHEAIEASEPNPSTFRDAVIRWSHDGDPAAYADDPL